MSPTSFPTSPCTVLSHPDLSTSALAQWLLLVRARISDILILTVIILMIFPLLHCTRGCLSFFRLVLYFRLFLLSFPSWYCGHGRLAWFFLICILFFVQWFAVLCHGVYIHLWPVLRSSTSRSDVPCGWTAVDRWPLIWEVLRYHCWCLE